MKASIAVIAVDRVGGEVTDEAVRVLTAVVAIVRLSLTPRGRVK